MTQPDSQPDAMGIFESLCAGGQAWMPPTAFVYRYRVTSFSNMTQAELDRAEAAIAHTPDHPDHLRLSVERRRLASPEIVEHVVWWRSPSEFRFSQTWIAGGDEGALTAWDAIMTPGRVWSLTQSAARGGQLAVLDPHAPPPAQRDLLSQAGDVRVKLALMLMGGLCDPWTSGFRPSRAAWEGTAIRGTSVHSDGIAMTVLLHRGPGEPEWRTAELDLTSSDPRPSFPWRFRFRDWARDDALGSNVAVRVERLGADGRLVERIDWLNATPLSEVEFESVTQIPTLDSVDPLRGRNLYTSVFDFRPGSNTYTLHTPESSQVIPLPAVAGAPPRWWNVAGWVAAGVLVASLVGIRVWRSRAP